MYLFIYFYKKNRDLNIFTPTATEFTNIKVILKYGYLCDLIFFYYKNILYDYYI